MPTTLRSRDRLDDDHMTAEVHRRWGGTFIVIDANKCVSNLCFGLYGHAHGMGAIQVLRNAVGVGGCQLSPKKPLQRCTVQRY